MERHNEHQKQALRERDENRKRQRLEQKGNQERAQMEKLSHLKFRIGLTYYFKEPKKFRSFTVYLHVPLGEQEIRDRMIKGFGDI
jgi:hypothetical protein